MKEIKYFDLRIYFEQGVEVSFLGTGQVPNASMMELALLLQNTIEASKLSDQDKQALLQMSVQSFISTVKTVANNTLKIVSEEQLSDSASMEQEVLNAIRNKGQCKCPYCGVLLKSIDGKVICLNCNREFGIIE